MCINPTVIYFNKLVNRSLKHVQITVGNPWVFRSPRLLKLCI